MKNSLKSWLQSAPDNEWTNEDKCREAMQQIHAQPLAPESQEQAVPIGELIANFLAVLPEPSDDENLNGYHNTGPEGPGFYYNGARLSDD
ncbi:hypothetical protein ACLEC2_16460 [Lonsdalea quercina]|uniref:hypothetical protein n=1 Tax=Lonsdalea quercina TaxID=71657 RepID=UPI003975F24C